MGKFLILWENLHKIATLSSSSESPDWPLSFLKNQIPSLFHKTIGKDSEWWKWDLGEAKDISIFIFWNHNFTDNASIRLQANSVDSWTSPPLDEELDWMELKIIKKFSSPKSYRFWRLLVQDSTNPDGYLQAGWAFLGSFFSTYYRPEKRSWRLIDPSKVLVSDAGQESAVVKPKIYNRTYSFTALPGSDIKRLETIFGVLGNTEGFFIIDNDDDLESTFYVRLITDFSFETFACSYSPFSFTVKELK